MNTIKKINTVLLVVFYALQSNAQVEIDKSIDFNNQNDDSRNVYNVGKPTEKNSGISIKTSAENSITYAQAISSSSNLIDLNTKTEATLVAGFQVQFASPITNTGAISISINGTGNYKLIKTNQEDLGNGEINQNQLIDAVFDGVNFQILTIPYKLTCPTGYAKVNNRFCIEVSAHAPKTWFEAVEYCMDREARLCNWSEFGLACDLLNDGTNDFTTNWEWTRTTGDHNEGARAVGFGGCNEGRSQNTATTTTNFRCCKDLR